MFNVYLYMSIVLTAIIAGICRYRQLHSYTRILLLLLVLGCINDAVTMLLLHYQVSVGTAHHIFSVFELILTTTFFLGIIQPPRAGFILAGVSLLWISAAVLNAAIFQSIKLLNTYILMIESVAIIAMSLYTMYRIMINEAIVALTRSPAFLLSATQLMLWSGTFFYWGTGIFLQKHGWHKDLLTSCYQYLNIIVYACIALIIILYPKSQSTR